MERFTIDMIQGLHRTQPYFRGSCAAFFQRQRRNDIRLDLMRNVKYNYKRKGKRFLRRRFFLDARRKRCYNRIGKTF